MIGIWFLVELFFLPWLILGAFIARFVTKKIDVGIGPEPILSHPYHQAALKIYGFSSETFVQEVYDIFDDFDIRFDKKYSGKLGQLVRPFAIYFHVIFRYKILYFYFTGGPLAKCKAFLWKLEPYLLHWARVKMVVMPYGGDVQEVTRNKNLLYKHGLAQDYPSLKLRRKLIERKIDLWTINADHIIGGLDWVDYMYHWDTLMISHFGINTEYWKRNEENLVPKDGTIRILHAPNHRNLKGTEYIIRAVDNLKKEGYPVELILRERVKNSEIKHSLENINIVVDQLVIGWYAMFAMEAMALGIPVVCYLREDLKELFESQNLLNKEDLPIVNAQWFNIEDKLRYLISNPEKLQTIGQKSRDYVEKYHSLEVLGKQLALVNNKVLQVA